MLLGDLRQVDWFLPFENGDHLGDRLQEDVNNLTFKQPSGVFLRQQKRSIITLACSEHWEKIGKNMWVKKGKNGILHDLSIGLDWGSK